MLTSFLLAFASSFGGCDKPAFTTFTSPTDFKAPCFSKFDFATSCKFDSFFKTNCKFGFVKNVKDACDSKFDKSSGFATNDKFVADSKDAKAFSFEKTDAKFDFVKQSKDAFEFKASKGGEVKAVA